MQDTSSGEAPEQSTERSLRPAEAGLSAKAREVALIHYDHVEQQASLAASKATMLATALAIVVAVYVELAKDCRVFTSLGTSLAGLTFGGAGVCLVAGLFLALAAVYPKTKNPRTGDVLFFASVTPTWPHFEDYWNAFNQRAESWELDRDVLRNIHGKSEWLSKNFRRIRAAIIATAAGASGVIAALFFFGGIAQISCAR